MHNCTLAQLDTSWLYWATMEVALSQKRSWEHSFLYKLKNCLNCKKVYPENPRVHPWGHSWQFSGPVAWGCLPCCCYYYFYLPLLLLLPTTTTSTGAVLLPKSQQCPPYSQITALDHAALPYTAFHYNSSVAGQVDVLHNGRGSGTNHKKRERRHFWPNCQILKLLLPTNYFWLTLWTFSRPWPNMEFNFVISCSLQLCNVLNSTYYYTKCAKG